MASFLGSIEAQVPQQLRRQDENLQTDINATGAGYCGVADGIFGSGTKQGVETYQGNRGLSVDGQAGYNTKMCTAITLYHISRSME